MEMQRDVFQYRDIHRLAQFLGFCLIQGRGRYLLLEDCESQVVIQEFTDLESVEAWLANQRDSPC